MSKHHLVLLQLLLVATFQTSQSMVFQFPWSENSREDSVASAKIQERHITLHNGVSAEVFIGNSQSKKRLPPLVFLHGSFHAAWCWTERFFPYFIAKGYPVAALSWRGTAGTPAGDGVRKVTAAEHCDDLNCFLDQLPALLGTTEKPILLSHSFGGIVVMKYLEEQAASGELSNRFAGLVSMCSVPPSGNGKMTMRYLRRSLRDSWKITAGFAMKRSTTNRGLCRELFFGGPVRELEDGTVEDYGVSDEDLNRYQSYFARDTNATIDLLDLAKHLPSKQVDKEGRAPFVNQLPPSLVIGAKDDFIVDQEGNLETAKYYGLEQPLVVDSPHDVMLGRKWQNCADAIEGWIQETLT